MKNDKLFRNSVIFSDILLFAILCHTACLGAATAAGQAVLAVGILVTAVAFVLLCYLSMEWIEQEGKGVPDKPARKGSIRRKPAFA